MKLLPAAAMVAALSAPAFACERPLPPPPPVAPPSAVHHTNATFPIFLGVVGLGLLFGGRRHDSSPKPPVTLNPIASPPPATFNIEVLPIIPDEPTPAPKPKPKKKASLTKPCHILTPKQKAAAQAAIHKLHEEKRRDTAAERKQAEALANDCRFQGDWFTLPVDDNGE